MINQAINGFSPAEVAEIRSHTGCSDPGFLRLNEEMLKRLHPNWFRRSWGSFWLREGREPIEFIRWHLLLGDRSPAIVFSESPFLVAAYSEEIDGVAMLEFNKHEIGVENRMRRGDRLITLNLDYSKPTPLAPDLVYGSQSPRRWYNFLPLIGDFLSRDEARLVELKESVPESWWERTWTMASQYDRDEMGVRDGRPGFAMQPAIGQQKWELTERGH